MLNTPATTVTFARRSVLESVAKTLEQYVFEEVPPSVIKGYRTEDGEQEYLVEWMDEFSDCWVFARDISDDIIEDFESGLEYAQVSKAYVPPSHLLGLSKDHAGNRLYLVKV
jgi:signal recognition particle protein